MSIEKRGFYSLFFSLRIIKLYTTKFVVSKLNDDDDDGGGGGDYGLRNIFGESILKLL